MKNYIKWIWVKPKSNEGLSFGDVTIRHGEKRSAHQVFDSNGKLIALNVHMKGWYFDPLFADDWDISDENDKALPIFENYYSILKNMVY